MTDEQSVTTAVDQMNTAAIANLRAEILAEVKRGVSSSWRSEKFDKIATALAEAQGEIGPAIKDRTNPAFKSMYATFASVREACRIPLASRKVALIQVLTDGPKGLRLVTELLHGDQWIRSEVAINATVTADPRALQGLGSIESYVRRYVLLGMLGIATDDDDDGNGAGGPGGNNQNNNGYGNNNDRQQAPPQQPRQQQQSAPQNNQQSAPQTATPKPAAPKAPTYPADLAGEEKDVFDALVNECKAIETIANLKAFASRIKTEAKFQEGAPHDYLVWVIGRMNRKITEAVGTAATQAAAAAAAATPAK
jgi:hypothetical protein